MRASDFTDDDMDSLPIPPDEQDVLDEAEDAELRAQREDNAAFYDNEQRIADLMADLESQFIGERPRSLFADRARQIMESVSRCPHGIPRGQVCGDCRGRERVERWMRTTRRAS